MSTAAQGERYEENHESTEEEDGSTDDDETASQTTEDDPEIPQPSPHVQKHGIPMPTPSNPNPPTGVASQHLQGQGPSHMNRASGQQQGARPQDAPAGRPPPLRKPNYKCQHVLRGHTMSISSVKFSPDGLLLASCGE